MLKCTPKTQGGKGNRGMFIERGSRAIAAAGKPTDQPYQHVVDDLKHYLLKDEVDALISDAIKPELKKIKPLRNIYQNRINVGELINPPPKSKFANLVDEMKETQYSSYWKKPLGKTRDLTPFLPAGFDVRNATFGKKNVYTDTAYGLIMPKDTPVGKTSPSLDPGYQPNRRYCPPYDPNKVFGMIYNPDKRGTYAKCCVTNDKMVLGTAYYSPRTALEVDILNEKVAPMGHSVAPHDNIKCVPKGYAFGKLAQSTGNVPNCLTTCPINSGREFFLKCLAQLNTLRKCLSKLFDEQFFRKFYLHLKYLDKDNTGWLPKDVVYNFCSAKNVRVNPYFIEPLLEMWNGFDDSQIEYRIFVDTINFTKPSAEIPKIPDIGVECLEFSTTYGDMVKPGQEIGERRMAAVSSGRYFDKDEVGTPAGMCKADRICLPEESDVRSCISPSNLSLFGVTHRDMYAKRSPELVRKVFEAAGENFTDERFRELWDEAKKYHSLGWVCFATFRQVLDKKL